MESRLFGSVDTAGPPGGSAPASMRGMESAPPMAMAPGGAPPGNALMGQDAGAPPAQAPMPSVDELEEGLQKTVYLNARFRELLMAKKLPTRKDVMNLSSELLQRGILSAPRLATELATLPEAPDQIVKWLEQHYRTTAGQINQLSMLLEGAADPAHPLNVAAGGRRGQPQGIPNGALR